VHLKEQSILKKTMKTSSKLAYRLNGNAMLVRTMHPAKAQCSGIGAWPKNKQN